MDVTKNSLHAGARLFSGGVAGMVAAVIVYPLEVVKTMLTLYPEECSSIPDALGKVFRTSGVRGLYRGLGPTLVAMVRTVRMYCDVQKLPWYTRILLLLLLFCIGSIVAVVGCLVWIHLI